MNKLMCLSLLLACASLVSFCTGQDSVVSVLNKLEEFEEDLLDNKMDMIVMQKRILNTIDVAKASLRAELKETIRDEVREAMAEVLQGETLQDMVKGQVISELRQLRHGYDQMKRQLHHVSRSFEDFQDETAVFHESILKKVDPWDRENSSDICIREKHGLEIELQKTDLIVARLKDDINRCTALKETCQSQKSQQITNITVIPSTPAPLNITSSSRSSVPTTTPRPVEEKRKIFIAPLRSSFPHHFRQVDIHNNSLTVYPYHTMKHVSSLAYIAKTNKLLIGLAMPDKIVSSTPNTRHVTLVRENVKAYGIAVDEDRDIVFMSTYEPRHSISRMSTQGKDFTAVMDLSDGYQNRKQIALDTRRKKIYVSTSDNLFAVTYDGQGLTTLATGSQIYAVTIDQRAGVLYYNIEKNLKKMTLSDNVTTQLTTLNAMPWNMRLYRGTIYYSGWKSAIVGAVDVTYNTVTYTLQSISLKGAEALCMCLIP